MKDISNQHYRFKMKFVTRKKLSGNFGPNWLILVYKPLTMTPKVFSIIEFTKSLVFMVLPFFNVSIRLSTNMDPSSLFGVTL